jgi:ABC-type branched-subunit amino acid transport system substrate-binding protein
MAILTAVKSKSPDAVFFGGMDAQGGPMLRQMEQLGMSNVKYFGGDGICTAEIAKLAAGAKTIGNVICAEGGSSLVKMPGGEAWKKRYDAKYPGQFQIYSPYTYDATFLLVDAMKRANSTDPKVYTPELIKSNFKGVTTTIGFDCPLQQSNHFHGVAVEGGDGRPALIQVLGSLLDGAGQFVEHFQGRLVVFAGAVGFGRGERTIGAVVAGRLGGGNDLVRADRRTINSGAFAVWQ